MALTAIIYSKKFLEHKTRMHCENPLRLEVALNSLKKFGLISPEKCVIVEPRMATMEELKLVHDESYIEEIKHFSVSGGGYYDGDTYLSKESFEVACYAVGGMLKICDEIFKGNFKNAFGLIRPPGHHTGVYGRALGASTTGFCLFNNIAILAAYTLQKQLAKKILIFDFDVHHGNGTQEIFNNSSNVLYISFHEKGIYPGTGFEDEIGIGEGKGYKINIPFPYQSDDSIYLKAFNEIVLPVSEEFKPELILISAGFDAHHSDDISSIQLSAFIYNEITKQMVKLSNKYCNGKLIACLEGGYSHDTLSKSLPATVAALTQTKIKIDDRKPEAPNYTKNKAEETIKNIKKKLNQYWKI